MNRTLVGDIADLHFSPTKANADNLRREAIMGDIFITGNTAIDAMQYTVKPDFVFPTALLNELDFRNHRIIAVTCHRRENYGKPMEAIMHAILEIVQTHPDVGGRLSRPPESRRARMRFPRFWAATTAFTSSIRSTWRKCTISLPAAIWS